MDSGKEQHGPRAPPEPAAFRFRGFALDFSRGLLRRPDGTEVALRPKSAALLRHLGRNPNSVVSRDELMDAVWPGVVVTDDSITQCVVEIRHALGDEGAQLLRTLPRRGYALEAEVTGADPVTAQVVAATALPPASALGSGTAPPRQRRRSRAPLLAAAGSVAAVLAATLGFWSASPRPLKPDPPGAVVEPPAATLPAALAALPAVQATGAAPPLSLVVLPFANLSGDAGEDHIADGITDDLTSFLARMDGSFVIGRGTAQAYKGGAADVRRIGRELGVRYVVQGSVRRVGPQLRVTAQIIDSATAAHRWAESFEEPFAGFADLTFTVASRIAEALGNSLLRMESDRARAKGAEDATVVDLLLRARVLLGAPAKTADLLEAERLFQRVLDLGEDSAEAHGFMCINLVTLWTMNPEGDREGLLLRAEEHARRAMELNPRHARSYFARGMVHQSRQRFAQALADYDAAIALWPSRPNYFARRGWVRNLTDSPAEALADFAHAVRMSPLDPWVGGMHQGMAMASLMLGRDADAVAHAVRAVGGNPNLPPYRLTLASTLALAGRAEEARTALDEYRKLQPRMTVARFRQWAQESSGHPLFLATRDREAEALRAVGLPAQ